MEVIHDETSHKIRLKVDPQTVAGYLTYDKLSDEVVEITHTMVPPEFGGKGYGSVLVKAIIEFAQNRDLKVKPTCWFAAAYFDKHPQYQDLLSK